MDIQRRNLNSERKKADQYQDIGLEILYNCQKEICARFPYFSRALMELPFVVESEENVGDIADTT